MIKPEERDTNSSPPNHVHLTSPDIKLYRRDNMLVPYVTDLNSGLPGPHTMILTLINSNEISDAIAVNHLLQNNICPNRGHKMPVQVLVRPGQRRVLEEYHAS